MLDAGIGSHEQLSPGRVLAESFPAFLRSSRVALPAARARLTRPPADVARVLLIEDDPSLRSVLSRLITQAGHDVLDTSDAASALGLVGIYGADVVITDVMVPGQDGIALLVAIRRVFPKLPLIAISGRNVEEIVERLEEERPAFGSVVSGQTI